ncbi:MAG: hypothetical protein WDK96_01265 [Candidatus Paceibacterota bacterium]|jgi:hypothetical protein
MPETKKKGLSIVKINKAFETKVIEVAKTLIKASKTEGILQKPGELTVFVDKKPKIVFHTITSDEPELVGKTIFVGSN